MKSILKSLHFQLAPINKILFYGHAHFCPLCESRLRFFGRAGRQRTDGGICPVCQSLERHRLTWLYLPNHTDLMDGHPKRMLHIAPEPALRKRLAKVTGLDHVAADLDPAQGVVQLDITDIQYPDHTFDVIFCSHVLEHVPDDRTAMRELRRVLRPGGWALLDVPVWEDRTTHEDPSVTDPQERERLFGQHDHVRRYGRDFSDRLTEAGFSVRRVQATELATAAELDRMGIPPQDKFFYCT